MLNEKMENWVKGLIELSWVKNGIWTPFHKQSNLIAYGSGDICAAAVAGLRKINGMYIAFENDAGADNYVPGSDNDAAYYATEVANRSFVRVTTLGEPIIEASDANYTGNRITFLGVTDGTTFLTAPLTDSLSVFYHSALVSIDDEGDGAQADDIIFSNADFSTTVTKVAGAQLGVKWEITFAKP